jgi:hypothetical protein
MASLRFIKVVGDNNTARAVRVALREQGFAIVDEQPTFTIGIAEATVFECPTFDSVDGPIERELFAAIRSVTPSGRMATLHAGGVQSEDEVRIMVPQDAEESRAVVSGIVVGCLQAVKAKAGRPRRWFEWRV